MWITSEEDTDPHVSHRGSVPPVPAARVALNCGALRSRSVYFEVPQRP
jgi:hypothetical protein